MSSVGLVKKKSFFMDRLGVVNDPSSLFYDKDSLIDETDRDLMIQSIISGWLTSQYDNKGRMFFNPNGIVTRAEVINTLVVSDKDKLRKMQYHEGYSILEGLTDNFKGVYTDEDLKGKLRFVELAYLMCSLEMGIDIEDTIYEHGSLILNYEDVADMPLIFSDTETNNLLTESGFDSIEDYFTNILLGKVPMVLELVVLTALLEQVIDTKSNSLQPLRGVSRLEFSRLLDILYND